MSQKWDQRFVELARHVATGSKDPRTGSTPAVSINTP